MSAILENKTVLEAGQRIQKSWTPFELVVIQPQKGKEGKLIFSATIHAENVSAAVKTLREQVEGSGFVVLQRSAFSGSVAGSSRDPIINEVVAEKMDVAYQLKYGRVS